MKLLPFLFCFSALNAQTISITTFNPDQTDLFVQLGITQVEVHSTRTGWNSRGTDETSSISITYLDSLGREIKQFSTTGRTDTTVIQYDERCGKIAQRTSSNSGFFFEYDSLCRVIAKETYDREDNHTFKKYEYDIENTQRTYQLVSQKHLNFKAPEGRRFWGFSVTKSEDWELETEKFFSPEGLLEETRDYKHAGKVMNRFFEYDNSMRLTKTYRTEARERILELEREYDAFGRLVTMKTFLNNTGIYSSQPVLMSTQYEYDENGLLSRVIQDGLTTEYFYYTD